MRASYKNRYRKKWAVNESGLDQLIGEDSFDARWDRPSDTPAVRVWHELSIGLTCLYSGDERRAKVFLCRTIRNADRLEAEDRFHDTEVAEAGHPYDLAEVIRARALAHWLLGEPLNRADLRRAAEMFVTWCLTKAEDRRRFIDSLTMSIYLQGVRCALMANDLDYARDLLATKHKFQWHHGNERELWMRVVSAFPKIDARLREDIEVFFDRVRDPDFKEVQDRLPTFINREALALDTGIIRQMYLVNGAPLDQVYPQAVIDAVAY
ncbi:MAG TPA: hypothetical protein PKK06_17905 [Phycisphaerae bacterium]|nr:hypothetical protein [Phycisphaerae bacterium]HNU47089.1 hypothetical protein [Phycisphaerae bacterium]